MSLDDVVWAVGAALFWALVIGWAFRRATRPPKPRNEAPPPTRWRTGRGQQPSMPRKDNAPPAPRRKSRRAQ